ncbi:MAG: copper amine oxidase N-terminal domain-containing protein, partial [Peptococcaceae bacterium]|nr:copper amine oxidase N-terminal domain-containing protein [Peptococcaceae bacterium]
LTEIVAQGDKKTVRIPVQIIGEKEIAKIEIMVNQQAEFTPGSSHQLTVVATLNDGTQKIVGSNALTFTADGFEASVSNDGVLTIGDLAENERYGSLIASYGGMTTQLGLRFSAANVVELQIDRNSMIKDGQEVAIDTAPLIKDNRTMVPIRFVSEALGGEVIWVDDGNDYQIAYVIYKENLLELPINEKMIYVNGEGKALDVPSQVIQDRTMVPLRAIVEGLGMTVEYKDKTREIIIEG